MKYIIFYVVAFIIINLFYLLFVIKKDKALKNMKKGKDVTLLCRLNKINIDDYDLKYVVKVIGLGNSIIVSTIGTLVLLLEEFISNFYIWILVGVIGAFIVLIPTILGVYKILGKVIIKGGKKNVL